MSQNNAKIYLNTKDVIDFGGSKELNPQHSYLVAEYYGKRYILRAGPSGDNPFGQGGNPIIGDLKFIGADNLVEYLPTNSSTTHYDWDFYNTHTSREIFVGTDEEVANKFNILRNLALDINQQNFDYRWNNQNCNTAMSYILHGAELDVDMQNLYDNNHNLLWMVGSDGIFLYNQPKNLNETVDSFFEYIKDFDRNNLTIKLNQAITIQKESFLRIISNNGEIRTDAIYVDENGNLIDYNQIIYSINNQNGDYISFIRNDVLLVNQDGSYTKLDAIIDNFKDAIKYTEEYLKSSIDDLINYYSDPDELASLILIVNDGINQNLSLKNIAEILATKVTVKSSIEDLQNIILFSAEDYELIKAENFNDISEQGKLTIEYLKNSNYYKIAYISAVSFVTEYVLQKGDLNFQEYSFLTINSIAQATASVAIEEAFKTSLLDSLPYSEALASGLGYGVSQLLIATISDYFADDKMNSAQWQSSLVKAGVVASAAGVGSALASALFVGANAGPIGSAIAVIFAYSFMGGKKLNQGEYFDKIAFYNSILAGNGIDKNFYAIDARGTTIISSTYYNDNIYGNVGDDILFGGDGTNTIKGGEGNDQIFGKGDSDIIFGNAGSDEIISGAGDDYVFAGMGNDIIYGLGGSDVIYADEIEISGENYINQITNSSSGAIPENDLIQGGSGDDIIYGQGGDDIIFGNQDDDIISGGVGNDIIIGGSGFNDISGGDGEDIIFSGNRGDNINGEGGNDEIYGGKGNDIIYGGAGNDIIEGDSGEDLIFGGFGDDIIFAGDEVIDYRNNLAINYKNSIHGEFGNDFLIGSNVSDLISDGEGDDIIYSGSGSDNIFLGSGDNLIYFNRGDGLDILEINQDENGNFNKNLGNNIISFNDFNFNNNIQNQIQIQKKLNDLHISFFDVNNNILADKIIIKNQFYSPENPQNLLVKTLQFDNKFSLNLNNLYFNNNDFATLSFSNELDLKASTYYEVLSAYRDQILIAQDVNKINFFKNNDYDNIFNKSLEEIDKIGNEFINQIEWLSIKKQRNIFGGHYQVWREVKKIDINTQEENQTIIGNFWSENIIGNQYINQIKGGSGNDRIETFAGDDIIFGGVGNDRIFAGADNDLILAGEGSDIINGAEGNDEIYGNDGADLIEDYSGNNLIFAGLGDDEIKIADFGNQIFGEDGNDKIYTQSNILNPQLQNYTQENFINNGNIIYGNFGNDAIFGGVYNDYLYGQSGADYISGGEGADYISGGADNDKIEGGTGDDKIFGDIGNDFIQAGAGDDLIWGGAGVDYIEDGEGDDIIRAGGGDDEIRDGSGNDKIFGESGNDLIRLNEGDNIVFGGEGNDIIYGAQGDDKIFGENGSDLIFDGAGSDNITTGLGFDLIVLELIKNTNNSIDVIDDFDKALDKIIIKADVKNSLNFLQIINQSIEVNNNLEITIGDNYKIVLSNTKINDLNQNNFQIGYSIDAQSKILFGENSSKILFGNDQDNQIYGSNFDDELFGGGGYDDLFGMGGDDILHYEADDKFIKSSQEIYSDEIAYYETYKKLISLSVIELPPDKEYYIYKPINNLVKLQNDEQKNVFESAFDLTNIQKIAQYNIPISSSRVQFEDFRNPDYLYIKSVDKVDYLFNKFFYFGTTNFYNAQDFDITGLNRSYDNFDGGQGFNSIFMTHGNDFLSFDDNNNLNSSRIKSIEAIFTFEGDDVINFSSDKFALEDLMVNGGLGNDRLWLGIGDDFIFGAEGDDEIFGGLGDDNINGGVGDDIIFGGKGNDVINAYYGKDKIYAEEGDDFILIGESSIKIDGGVGEDEADFSDFINGVKINLINNLIQINYQNFSNNSDIEINFIENISASNYNDEIIGNNLQNIIKGNEGDDILSGDEGDDIYVFENNHGIDKIYEEGANFDGIKFGNSIALSDIELQKVANNLIIYTDKNKSHQIDIINQFEGDNKIDFIEFHDGNKILIPQVLEILSEDEEFIIDEEYLQKNFLFKDGLNNITLQSTRGSFVYNQSIAQIIFRTSENYHGFVEINLGAENLNEKILLFYNSKNDVPQGQINNFSYKVNQEIAIDFKNYFYDSDDDNIKFELALDNYNILPNWINFDESSGVMRAIPARNENLKFNIKIFDENGGKIDQSFKISIARDIAQDTSKVINKNRIFGDLYANKIYAKSFSRDLIIADGGDDEIFYLEDGKWQNSSTVNFKAWNVYSGDVVDIVNKIRSDDCFDGGAGYDILNLTNQDDAIFLDDQSILEFGRVSKISDIEEIYAYQGDDLVDITSREFNYYDIKIWGGEGNDILWSNIGDDEIYGENGDDNIQGGGGADILSGGEGSDIIKGNDGNDLLRGEGGADILFGGQGFDIFMFTKFTDSNFSQRDIVRDFEIDFDKIALKGFNYKDIKKFIDEENSVINQPIDGLFYKIDENYNTMIFDNNANFSIILEGQFEINNDNLIYI